MKLDVFRRDSFDFDVIIKFNKSSVRINDSVDISLFNSLDLEVGSKVIFTERIPPAPDVLLQFAYDIFTNFSFL